jgi:hypothetical protein
MQKTSRASSRDASPISSAIGRPAARLSAGFFGGRPATIAGYVHELRKRGNRNSIVLDDRTGRMEVTFFDEVHQKIS